MAEGAEAAIPAWEAEKCHRTLGQESSEKEEKMRAGLAPGTKVEERDTLRQSNVGALKGARHLEGCGPYQTGAYLEDG